MLDLRSAPTVPAARFTEVGGETIEYMYHKGEGRGPALVFLHEGVGSARQWKRFPWEAGRALGCPVLVYSRRGHGHSAPLDGPRTPRFMHDEAQDELPALLQRLRQDHGGLDGPLVLVGHSDGATIALLHAALCPSSPVEGIVAIAPHVFVEVECLDGVNAAVEAFSRGDLSDKLAKYHRSPSHTFFAWADIWRDASFRHWNVESLLPRVRVPVQLVQGRDDEYGTMEQCAAIARGVEARVDVIELGECGHNPPRARPDATRDAIVGFVRRLPLPITKANA